MYPGRRAADKGGAPDRCARSPWTWSRSR